MNTSNADRSWRTVFTDTGVSAPERWRALTACLFAFCLPLAPAVLPLLMLLLVATHLIDADVWRRRPLLRMDVFAPAIWLELFFLLHVIGMAWTTNRGFGWFDIGIKTSLFLIPLLALMRGVRTASRDPILVSFCLGNAVTVVLCLLLAVFRAAGPEGAGSLEFLSSAFAATLHPSYFALYLAMALTVYFMGGVEQRMPPIWGVAFVLLACVGLVLTQSRMGWITLPIVLGWSLILRWQDRRTRRFLLRIFLSVFLAGTVLTLFSANVRDRVMELFSLSADTRPDAAGSAAIRTVLWGAARDVASSNWPWGTGTGDVKDELILRYKEIGATHAVERTLNAHNQFLQSFAALGLPGLLTLVLLFALPLIGRSRVRGPDRGVRACGLLLLALNFAVESMLEVQAGTLFAAFLLWVLWWPRTSVASSRS